MSDDVKEWPEGYVITSRADMAAVLRQARMSRGMTCLELDHVAGFHDGYTGKLEHPDTKSGKRGLQLSGMAEVWIDALDLVLALVPKPLAQRLGFATIEGERQSAPYIAKPFEKRTRKAVRSRNVSPIKRTVRNVQG